MKPLLLFCFLLIFPLFNYAQSDTSAASASANTSFLDFVKKVYFNPTILLKTQNFKAVNNVQIQLLPSNSSQSPQSIKGFELAMQKVIRFILESGSEGIVRYYFNPNFPSTPFSVVCSEELHCKFTSVDIDSITNRLNTPFKNAAINYNNSALFEGAIQSGMDYTAQCLRNNPGKCGNKPENLISEINTKPLYITLHNTNGSKYDTDTFHYENYSSYYTQVYDLFTQQNVHVPAKLFIAGGSTEPLSLAIHKREANILKQNFRIVYMATEQALELEPGSSADSLKIKLPQHLPANQIAEFGVYYKSSEDSITYLVGSFMVHVYTEKVINLHLVSVDGAAIPQQDIATALKKMYDPVGVKFNISTTKSISSESFLTKDITIENSGLLSSYTKDLRNYVGAVKDLSNYDKDDYYIVFGLSCNNGVTGYMPRKSNIGFVFTSAADAGDVLAHEIGHGAFHLRHIFADEELGASMQGMTKNLMDYVDNPTDLYVSQWEGIDDPVAVGWFEGDDEEGALSSGLVAYYFWEEQQGGTFFSTPGKAIHTEIINNKITNAYKKNKVALLKENTYHLVKYISLDDMRKAVDKKVETNFLINDLLNFSEYQAQKLQSVIYYSSHSGRWESVARPPVIYFYFTKTGTGEYVRTYSHCSDSIILPKHGIKMLANIHVIVRVYKKQDNTTDYYKLYDFSGNDITDQIINEQKRKGERYLIFSNGYRDQFQNWDITDGLVTDKDRYNYWPDKMEENFKTRLKPVNTFFIDGSDRITTSNHVYMPSFALSMTNVKTSLPFESHRYDFLNATPNVSGFSERKDKGALAAKAFLSARNSIPLLPDQKDTIDIVCHSMGYAYAVGFIDELKEKCIFGRIYIIAPENACSGSADWTQFEEVWQYGSNNNPGDPDRDSLREQDGVAPQCAVKDIENIPENTPHGRVYIPKTVTTKSFLGSHSIANYMWIFDIKSGNNGYIEQR